MKNIFIIALMALLGSMLFSIEVNAIQTPHTEIAIVIDIMPMSDSVLHNADQLVGDYV